MVAGHGELDRHQATALFSTVQTCFFFYIHEVSCQWVIVCLETLVSDAVVIWQQPYERDAILSRGIGEFKVSAT